MIREARTEDLTIVTQLAILLWPDDDYNDMQNEMKETILDKNALIALSYQDSNCIAFAQCQLRNDYVEGTQSSPVGYLEGIYVKEAYRKKGVAKKLLKYCEKWAKENGCEEFGSDCELSNIESYNFHLKVGFSEANRIICFYKKLL
jgi:aminoglycoside 6'-N-acetyltransferase I